MKRSVHQFLFITLLFEGGLAALALLIGWLTSFSPWYGFFNSDAHGEQLASGVLWGVTAALPLVAFLFWDGFDRWTALQGLKDDVSRILRHYLQGARHWQLLAIAAMAGLGEELLFRGLLQAGLAALLPADVAIVGSVLVASVIFGACHYLSHTYFMLATIAGLYFGLLMINSGSLLAPIIAHALYDYVALAYLLSEE